jgi:hypothetical protein
MSYFYQHTYGVEPYAQLGSDSSQWFGGGAKVTNDNLLRTLWTVDSFDFFNPASGRLLKPFGATQTGIDANASATAQGAVNYLENSWRLFANSRLSCRFYLSNIDDEGGDLSASLLAVLTPPPDMKQRLAQAVSAKLDPSKPLGFSLEFKRGVLQDPLAWFARFEDVLPGGNAPRRLNTSLSAVFGAFFTPISLCKTDGSDGNFPEFYNLNTAEGVVAQAQAMLRGEFFVPCLFTAPPTADESVQGVLTTISWTGSPGRR